MNKHTSNLFIVILSIIFILAGCAASNDADTPSLSPIPTEISETAESAAVGISLDTIPKYSGLPYIEINNNQPYFTEADYTTVSFEDYSPLDDLGRCGVAFACIGQDIMPTKERQEIGQVKPAGWHTVKYDVVGTGSAGYLYNRCHLIAHELAGEDANVQNLITGTRYMNMVGMRGFEDSVADYVRSTGNHVLYRVTPIFQDDNLIADGVLMEAMSMEDTRICFCVFCYNIQPGIEIDYATGDSRLIEASQERPNIADEPVEEQNGETVEEAQCIGNKNTKKFHYPSCSSVSDIKESNKVPLYCTRDEAIAQGYSPCSRCSP